MNTENETGREGEAQDSPLHGQPAARRYMLLPAGVASVIETIRHLAATHAYLTNDSVRPAGGPPTVGGELAWHEQGFEQILEVLDDYVRTVPIEGKVTSALSRQNRG